MLLGGCTSNDTSSPTSTSAASSPTSSDGVATALIIKSANDDRGYRPLTLANGLRALVVSDSGTDKGAAALVVLRGSYDDPEKRQGLAHFLEHMLFIGTEKYPEVDGYQSFLATHGGSSNAYTAGEHTNYFFDVAADQLDAALDRFAQFFISPLLDSAYVEREKNAVHSEYQLQLKDDGWRGFAVQKKSMNPKHPGSKFNIGNLKTLGGNVGDDLVEFFKKAYSADQMLLVVLGSQSLDELETLVTSKFNAIANHEIGERAALPEVVRRDLLPIEVRYRTIKDTRTLSYSFPVPSLDAHYQVKPGAYIANLLGHEGEGSLYSQLRLAGLVESVAASNQRFDQDNSFLSIDIELTQAGVAQVQTITEALFDYLELVKAEGINRWRYDEQAAFAQLAFRYREKGSAMGFVYSLAPVLAQYPIEQVLTGPQLMQRFDADLIRSYLNWMRPDNVVVTLAGQAVATNLVEPYFDVPYALEPTVVKFHEAPDPAQKLPGANPFVPSQLALLESDAQTPTIAVQSPGLSLWSAPDTHFGTPRASLFLEIAVAGGNMNAADSAAAQLYARLVQDKLNASLYAAQLAGLGYQIGSNGVGFNIDIAGYSDKQALLLERVLTALTSLKISPDRLNLLRTELVTGWNNFRSERPYSQAWSALTVRLNDTSFAPEELATALSNITAAKLSAWRDAKFARVGVIGLAHGNLSRERVKSVAALVSKRLRLAEVVAVEPTIAAISGVQTQQVLVDHDDSATVIYLQGRDTSLPEQARFGFASQLIRSPYFTALRTERQLGYVVAATNSRMYKTPGLVFVVQSPVASNAEVVAATREFADDYVDTLAAMSSQEFAAAKSGYLSQLLEKDKNQYGRSQRYWRDLLLDITNFDGREQLAAQVKTLDQTTMVATMRELAGALRSNYLLVTSPGKFKSVAYGGNESSKTRP